MSTNQNPVQLAIVSPCSRCKNQLSDAKGVRPPCPRRQLQKRKAELEAQGLDTQHLDHLVLTGCEILPQNAGNVIKPAINDLRNPVYWNEGKTVLVWVAALADNPGIVAGDGKLITPHLLDPSFDTSYLQCRPLPVVPAATEGSYFTNGAFGEGQQLEIRLTSSQQLDLQSQTPNTVLVDGFAQKTHFAFSVPRRQHEKDHVPPGV